MTRSFPKLLALGAGFAVFSGMLGGGIMLAKADDKPTPPAQATPAPTKPKGDPKAYADDFLQKLADNLGIDVATLKGALKKTSEDELQKLVDDGTLTQTQADKIKTMIESGDGTFGFNLPFFGARPGGKGPNGGAAPNGAPAPNGGAAPNGGPGPGGPGFRMPFFGMASNDAIAAFLGIDAKTYLGELQAGKTPAAIAAEHGQGRDSLKNFLTQDLSDRLAKAVAANKLSQAQADDIMSKSAATIDHYLDSTIHIGRFGPKGPPPGQPNTQPAQPNQAPHPSGGA
jgi:hypothetical protein